MSVKHAYSAADVLLSWAIDGVQLTEEVVELVEEVKTLEEENRILRYSLATERSRYTLGGTPPGYHEPGAWANRAQPPPSATDESAPPLRRGLS